jgi:chorismate dehydratase
VPKSPQPRLRIAAIDFLNPAPLMWDFEHEPEQARLAERYAIERMMPSVCAARLLSGDAELGLVPIAAYATVPGLAIVPGCTVASLNRVRSLLLVVREEMPFSAIKTVAADTSSQATLTYTRILFQKWWNPAAQFLQHKPDLDSMLAACDAALLIGDPALLALEDCAARKARTGEKLLYLDLAEEWKKLTGLPWISAVWAVRQNGLSGYSGQQICADFLHSRDAGIANIEALVEEWRSRIAVPAATIREYLSNNIHYILDDACLEGMRVFYRYAAEAGVLPPVGELRFLR